MHKRKTYQKISSNAQHIHGNNNNQAGRDINHNNFLGSLAREPMEIEFDAMVNYHNVRIVALALSAFLSAYVLSFTAKAMKIGVGDVLILWCFLSVILYPTIMSFLTGTFIMDILSKFLRTKVTYINKTLTYGSNTRKFYDEIWDMQYKPSLFGSGATLSIYVVNSKRNPPIPYRDDIVFQRDAQAKYIYDTFQLGNADK